jgi:hypothetical protein
LFLQNEFNKPPNKIIGDYCGLPSSQNSTIYGTLGTAFTPGSLHGEFLKKVQSSGVLNTCLQSQTTLRFEVFCFIVSVDDAFDSCSLAFTIMPSQPVFFF